MIKFIKWAFGILILPLCAAVSTCAWKLMTEATHQSLESAEIRRWALPAGFLSWALVFFIFPKPWRMYVWAHELSHALSARLMGASIGKMEVGKSGGSVEVSKSNFIIELAPYFTPLYTVFWIALFLLASLFIDLAPYRWLGLAGVGFTWSFHLTFTGATLMQRQTDIQINGRLFSYAIIYFFNVTGICCWITAIGTTRWRDLWFALTTSTRDAYLATWNLVQHLINLTSQT